MRLRSYGLLPSLVAFLMLIRLFADQSIALLPIVPLIKSFVLQLSDGERFDPPFSEEHSWFVDGEAPQFTWSKHAQPLRFEHGNGAYLPITDISKAWILAMGFKGWDILDRDMRDPNYQLATAAMKGTESWKSLQKQSEPIPKA